MSLYVSDNFHCSEICFIGYQYSTFVFFSFWEVQGGACHKVCGLLVLQSGIRLVPPAGEAQRLNPWTTREFLIFVLFYVCMICLFLSLFIFNILKFYGNEWVISAGLVSGIQQTYWLIFGGSGSWLLCMQYFLIAVHGLLTAVVSLVELRLSGAGSAVPAHGVTCPRHVGSS